MLLQLTTRLIADVVLVGMPNAGKSSLIAALTGARAQVGWTRSVDRRACATASYKEPVISECIHQATHDRQTPLRRAQHRVQ